MNKNIFIAWLLLFVLFAQTARALDPNTLPTGFNSVTGDGSASQTGNTLNVNTGLNRSIAEWQTFNIGANSIVNFNLPGSNSAILNRVNGGFSSEIFGQLNSNGRVFLLNPSGILFAPGAQVNVGSLMVSTLGLSNSDFLTGNYLFKQFGNPASIINQGTITTANGGVVNLFASAVSNTGSIQAPGGQINLAVGDQISFTNASGIGFQVTVDQPLTEKVSNIQNAIHNSGTLKADLIKLQTDFTRNLYQLAVNNTGLIEANSAIANNGIIHFVAGNPLRPLDMGNLNNSGAIRSNGWLGIEGATLDNAGNIHSDGDLNILLNGAKTITRDSPDRTLIHSSNGDKDFNLSGRNPFEQITFSLFNRPNASISAGNDLNIQASSVFNSSASMEAGNDLNIFANLLVNERIGFYTEGISWHDGIDGPSPYLPGTWERSDEESRYAYWIDRVGDYAPGYLGAGRDINLAVNYTVNKDSLLEASRDLNVKGNSFTNTAKVLMGTQARQWVGAGTFGSKHKQYFNPAISISGNYSSVFAGEDANFDLEGNFINQSIMGVNGNLGVKAANATIGSIDKFTQTPPANRLPSQIKLPYWEITALDLAKINSEREAPFLIDETARLLAQQLREALFNLTGRSYLGDTWKSAADTLRELEINRNEAMKADLTLQYGVSLTPEQIAKLTEPILWLEPDENGNLHYVVYIPENYRQLSNPEGLLQAANMNLEIKDTFHNTGTVKTPSAPLTGGTSGNIEIAADKIINEQRTVTRSKDVRVNDGMFRGHTERVYYEEIQSGGNLSGGNITLRAGNSITNRGGDIAAEDTVKLSAPIISNEAQVGSEVLTWKSTTADKLLGNKNTYSVKPVYEGASISGNNVEITSPASLTGGANAGTFNNIGSSVYGDEKVSISGFETVNNNWIAGTYTVKDNYSLDFSPSSLSLNHEMKTAHITQSSLIGSGGDIEIKANTFNNVASDVVAGNNIKVQANNINITDGTVQSTDTNSSLSLQVNLPATASLNYQNTEATKTTHRSSNFVAGNNIDLTPSAPLHTSTAKAYLKTGGTSGSINIIGSNLAAGNNINLSAQSVNIQNGLYTDTTNTSGGSVFAGVGAGYAVVGASGFTSDGNYQGLTPSTLQAGNQINITSPGSVRIKASELQASDSINVTTPNLSISGKYQRSHSENRGANAYLMIGPNGPMGGGAGINGGYDKSGKYFTASLNAQEVNLNAPNQQLDGVRINNQNINPHSDYHEAHQFGGGLGFGGGTASVNLGLDDFSIAAGTGQSSFASLGYKQFNVGANIGEGANGNNRVGVFGSAYGFGGGLGRTGIDNHPDLIDFSLGYGPLALGGTSQGGELKTGSLVAGFKQFDTQFSPIDWTCFKAGTPITMADGSKKAIEQIKKGDSIKAYDEKTKQLINAKVKQVFERWTDSYLAITLQDGELIEVTEEHPFFTNKGWTAAKELKPNTLIKTINGFISVQSIKQLNQRIKVYNFEVENFHTYLVGAAGLLVHNDCVFDSKTNSFSWKEDGYKPKEGEVKLTEEQTQTLAFVSGFATTLTEDQLNALVSSTAIVFGLTATQEGKEYLASSLASFSESFDDFLRHEPIDPFDLRIYRYGELSGHTGTTLAGIGEILGGSSLFAGSGVLELGTAGGGSVVAIPGAIAGAGAVGHGISTTATGVSGFKDTFNQMQGEQGTGGGGNKPEHNNLKQAKEGIGEAASQLGFNKRIPPQKAPFNSHGQPVFFDGRKYITPDVDSHNVSNGWKVFDKKGNRLGTYSSDLQVRIKN